MATKLAALLRTSSMGLPELANIIQSKGRNGDTILAHINPREARLLKAMGGSGTRNPDTGLLEFADPLEDYQTPEEYKQQPIEQVDVGSRPDIPTVYADKPAPASSPTQVMDPAQTQQQALQAQETIDKSNIPSYMESGDKQPSQASMLATTPAPAPAFRAYDASEAMPRDVTEQPGMFAGMGDKADALAKALGTDRLGLLKLAAGGIGAMQGASATRQAQGQAETNQKQIEALGAPYKERGQQLVAMGQAGQLTAPQQQALNALRAQQAQRMQAMGQAGGGTMQMQAEASIQQMAQKFAQDNIDQGMKLINMSDRYVMDAIKQGYAQNKDAMTMSGDFYKTLLSSIPGATQQAQVPGTAKT